MNTYKLTASYKGKSYYRSIEADTNEEATELASFKIMDLAYNKDNAWANGRIVLADSEGNTIDSMDSKEK